MADGGLPRHGWLAGAAGQPGSAKPARAGRSGKTGGETSAKQVFHRLAYTWRLWGERHGYFDSPEDAQAFYDELVHMLARQMAAPNSPQWFNTGLHAVYGIEGPPQGHYYADPATGEVKLSENAYERPQPHACQPYWAPISTPRGPFPIGEIVEKGLVGLEVFDGTDGGAGTTRVVAVKANGVKPVLRVVLKNGAHIDATGDHLVWARDERRQQGSWRRVDELAAGMRLVVASRMRAAVLAVAGGRSEIGEALAGGSPGIREEAIVRIEELGPLPVYDVQTESARYLSNNIVVHNCFIQSIEDDLVAEGGIMDLIAREARIFKYGSGTGSNFSKLRGRREPLSGGGISSGVLSFLRVNDRSASSIKSGGTTRRAAKMVILDADHPDIGDYIDWKVTEEHKVASMVTGSRILRRHAKRLVELVNGGAGDHDPELRAAIADALRDEVPPVYVHRIISLARQGVTDLPLAEYSTEWDDEAYNTVSGQSSNNSVRVTNAFMQAVLDDSEWDLVWRTDSSHREKVKARALWEKIAVSAWQCADPGLQFHTTINEWHTCPVDGEIRATNPCVTGDTLIATDRGLQRIESLVGRERHRHQRRWRGGCRRPDLQDGHEAGVRAEDRRRVPAAPHRGSQGEDRQPRRCARGRSDRRRPRDPREAGVRYRLAA